MKRSRTDRLMRCMIIGIGIFPLPLIVIGLALGLVPWNIFDSRSPQLSEPPSPMDVPWVSGGLGWAVVLISVGLTALTLRLDRGAAKRIEPLALVAICIAVLGHAEAIYGSRTMASTGAWPVNVIQVSIWILLVAGGVGALAWVRILLSKTPLRGRIFATCALVCSLCSAWIVHTFLVDRWVSADAGDGVELAVTRASCREGKYWVESDAVVRIRKDGKQSPASIEEMARSMQQDHGMPDDPISIRADRRASWSAVSRSLADIQETGIWKLSFATRWVQPEAARRVFAYSRHRVNDSDHRDEPKAADLVLSVSKEGAYQLNDDIYVDRSTLLERLVQPSRRWSVIRIEADEDARWEAVIEALSTVIYSGTCEEIHLEPLALKWG